MSRKHVGVCFLWWLLGCCGILGFHRMYVGKIGTGLLWLMTGGMFGIGALVDLFCLGGMCHERNVERQLHHIRTAAARR